MSTDQNILLPIICQPTSKVDFLEKELLKEYPELVGTKFFFTSNGQYLDKNKTLENHNIKDKDKILLNKMDKSEDISLNNILISLNY